MATSVKSLLLVGGSGTLGQNITNAFKNNWKVINIDYHPNPNCVANFLLKEHERPKEYVRRLKKEIENYSKSYDSVICVAGGWVQGSIKDDMLFENLNTMSILNVVPSLLAAHLSSLYIKQGGLTVLTGASVPFKDPTPSMITYGLCKTAVHALGLNLSNEFASKSETATNTVVTILPETIDTPANRKAMPDADFKLWNPPDKIAGLLKGWAEGENRPANGSFALLKTKNGSIVPEFV